MAYGPFLHLSFFSLNAQPLLPLLVMISRTLGPEVGGSIGLMFYLANVCGCAVSLLGLVESVLDVFGAGLYSPRPGLGGAEFFGVWDSGVMFPKCTHQSLHFLSGLPSAGRVGNPVLVSVPRHVQPAALWTDVAACGQA